MTHQSPSRAGAPDAQARDLDHLQDQLSAPKH